MCSSDLSGNTSETKAAKKVQAAKPSARVRSCEHSALRKAAGRHVPRGRPSRAPEAKRATARAERRPPRRAGRPARPRAGASAGRLVLPAAGCGASDGGIRRVKGSRRASFAAFPEGERREERSATATTEGARYARARETPPQFATAR